MTSESQQIAREAAEEIAAKHRTFGYHFDVEQIILSSIERATEFHSLRWRALQTAQHDMRDPERKMVCDILANGSYRR